MTMPYSEQELQTRLRLGEDNGWEFKQVEFRGDEPTSPQRSVWADEIVAFANASGGTLLLGVDDDGSVSGMSRTQLDAVERMVSEICRDSISPEIYAEIYRSEIDGRAFLLVQTPVGHAQYERDGRSYIRVGSSKRLMSSDERLRLAQRRGQARFRGVDEQPVSGTGFRTLSEQLWKPLLSAEGLADPQTGLEKLGLLISNEHGRQQATVAGVLLCSEQPHEWLPQAVITAVAYRSDHPADGQIDARVIEGPLNRQVADGVAFAMRNMRTGALKSPGREEFPEYSDRAIFEALVNAVAHRDYSLRGSRIRMRMFSDRIEISSPGSLPNGLTIDKMGVRQSTRNQVLASILSRLRAAGVQGAGSRQYFMDRRGDGVLIIQQETEALTGTIPKFELFNDSELRITIPKASPSPVAHSVQVTIRSNGQPIPEADILALYPNQTWTRAVTDHEGSAPLKLYATHLPMTIYVAAPGMTAHVSHEWTPAEQELAIDLDPLPMGGSTTFAEGTGHLPGLSGTLNPILDSHGRTYLYASNISINDGEPQPVTFQPGNEELHLVDSNGHGLVVRIVAINGRSSLIEYRSEDAA